MLTPALHLAMTLTECIMPGIHHNRLIKENTNGIYDSIRIMPDDVTLKDNSVIL